MERDLKKRQQTCEENQKPLKNDYNKIRKMLSPENEKNNFTKNHEETEKIKTKMIQENGQSKVSRIYKETEKKRKEFSQENQQNNLIEKTEIFKQIQNLENSKNSKNKNNPNQTLNFNVSKIYENSEKIKNNNLKFKKKK